MSALSAAIGKLLGRSGRAQAGQGPAATTGKQAREDTGGMTMSEQHSMSMGDPGGEPMSMDEPDRDRMMMRQPGHDTMSMGQPDHDPMTMGDADEDPKTMNQPQEESM
jgi:hypothetical protein